MRFHRFLTAPVAAAFLSCFVPACGGSSFDWDDADYDVQRYDLSGTYDWARERLVATVAITLTASHPGLEKVVLDSAVTEVKAVRAREIELPFSVDAKKRKLSIDVSGIARRDGEPIVLHVDYEAASGRGLL